MHLFLGSNFHHTFKGKCSPTKIITDRSKKHKIESLKKDMYSTALLMHLKNQYDILFIDSHMCRSSYERVGRLNSQKGVALGGRGATWTEIGQTACATTEAVRCPLLCFWSIKTCVLQKCSIPGPGTHKRNWEQNPLIINWVTVTGEVPFSSWDLEG